MLGKQLKKQRARLGRIRHMPLVTIRQKLAARLIGLFSPRRILRRFAYALERLSRKGFRDIYVERQESGPVNLQSKQARQAAGGPFEPYPIVLVNRSAVALVKEEKKILEVGCGTGMFASLAAQDRSRQIVASEFDIETLDWAKEHRNEPNIEFGSARLEEMTTDAFELVVAIEVIEHLWDYADFLTQLSRVAPRAIITTPNKDRSPFDSIAVTPAFHQHTREWTAGELYWVLRAFYEEVQLWTLPSFERQIRNLEKDSNYQPVTTRCSVLSQDGALIADCRRPFRR